MWIKQSVIILCNQVKLKQTFLKTKLSDVFMYKQVRHIDIIMNDDFYLVQIFLVYFNYFVLWDVNF